MRERDLGPTFALGCRAQELREVPVITDLQERHLNPLGAKGIGEASTIGSTPAVKNAVIDAISHLGVRHLDMQCTPERVWNAINDAKNGTLQDPWSEPPAIFDQLSK